MLLRVGNKLKKMNTIQSKIIGKLKQDDQIDDWWESELIEIPFFNKEKLKIIFTDFIPESDLENIGEWDNALKLFLENSDSDRIKLSHLVYKNCTDFLKMVEFNEADQHLRKIKNKNKIWDYVQPNEIYISRRPYQDKDIYVNINCECDWEQEHGLQLVFKQGKKITRISQIDGHLTEADAYDKPDCEDTLLSQFNDNGNETKLEWWKFWK